MLSKFQFYHSLSLSLLCVKLLFENSFVVKEVFNVIFSVGYGNTQTCLIYVKGSSNVTVLLPSISETTSIKQISKTQLRKQWLKHHQTNKRSFNCELWCTLVTDCGEWNLTKQKIYRDFFYNDLRVKFNIFLKNLIRNQQKNRMKL